MCGRGCGRSRRPGPGLDPAAPHDPKELAQELLQALGLAEQVVVDPQPPAHRAVLQLPV